MRTGEVKANKGEERSRPMKERRGQGQQRRGEVEADKGEEMSRLTKERRGQGQ